MTANAPILIAGFGSIGRRHLQNLRTLGHKKFVLYRTGNSTVPDEEIAGIPTESDLDKALAHKPIAAIIAIRPIWLILTGCQSLASMKSSDG